MTGTKMRKNSRREREIREKLFCRSTEISHGLTPFGIAVKSEAVKKGFTLKQVAERVGASYGVLKHIIYGRRPGYDYVEKIAELLEINLEDYAA